MERITSVRQTTCPWQAMRDPFVIEVLRAHRWWKQGQLAENYGGAVPEAIRQGVDAYEVALRMVRAHDERKAAEKRAANDELSAAHGAPLMPASRLTRRWR